MKKIFAVVLMCAMMVSMVACSSSGWKTKKMSPPQFDMHLETVKFTASNGTELTDTILVSPLTHEKHKPEQAFEQLKAMGCFSGWEFEYAVTEKGRPYTDASVGELTAYNEIIDITATELKDNKTTGRSLLVRYIQETDECRGYYLIGVNMNHPDGTEALSQKEMLSVLNIIYGDDFAKYLCYAKMTEESSGTVSNQIESEDMAIRFERYVDDKVSAFAIMMANMSKDYVNGYAGDYKSHVERLPVFQELFGLSDEESKLTDTHNFAKSFIEKYYGDGMYCIAPPASMMDEYGFYTYTESQPHNGAELDIYAILTKGEKDEQYNPGIQLTVYSDEQAVYAYAALELSAKAKTEVNEEWKPTYKALAREMVKDILNVESADDAFESDKYFTITIDGMQMYIKFRIDFIADDTDKEYAVFSCNISTSESAIQSAS